MNKHRETRVRSASASSYLLDLRHPLHIVKKDRQVSINEIKKQISQSPKEASIDNPQKTDSSCDQLIKLKPNRIDRTRGAQHHRPPKNGGVTDRRIFPRKPVPNKKKTISFSKSIF